MFSRLSCQYGWHSAYSCPPCDLIAMSTRQMLAADDRFQNQLKAIRTSRGLTQAALAEQVGVSRKTVNTVENGIFVPSVLLALRLARALDTTVEAIFGVDSPSMVQ
ncbi:helix-turn-helix transcriptional regulator [Gluconobacter kondonii]|uniref:helix-turn-helix transcriptional regulator n=1 Tax=Gluconobacter kondonii TaxID=941463 RepID=UPI0031FEC973